MRRTTRMEKKKADKRGGRAVVVLSLILLVLIFGGLAAGKIYVDRNISIDTFYQGVSIDGVDLGGMTQKQALDKLEALSQPRMDEYHISLQYGDQQWDFDYHDIDAKTNAVEIVNQAYGLGREGSLLSRIKDIKAIKEEGVFLNTDLSYNLDAIKGKLDTIADALYKAPVDATITFFPKKEDKFVITDEKEGWRLDTAQVFDQIKEQMKASPKVKLNLELTKVEPKVFAADLQKQTKKIATFSTNLGSSSDNRKHNVYLALKQFDGMVVQPGQEISFNQTTGQRTKENGYLAAPVIKADKSLEDDLGGGVCQSSSTLYNAVLYAGLEIVQRTHHSFPSTYVDKGLDATVNWPNLDFVFRNNGTSPVYIHTYDKEKDVFVEVYGEGLPDNQEVKLETNVYKVYSAPKPKTVEDTKQQYVTYKDQTYEKVKSRPGYKVKSYRVLYEDGKEVSRELLYDDYYKPITGLIYKGVKDRPKPAAEEKAAE